MRKEKGKSASLSSKGWALIKYLTGAIVVAIISFYSGIVYYKYQVKESREFSQKSLLAAIQIEMESNLRIMLRHFEDYSGCFERNETKIPIPVVSVYDSIYQSNASRIGEIGDKTIAGAIVSFYNALEGLRERESRLKANQQLDKEAKEFYAYHAYMTGLGIVLQTKVKAYVDGTDIPGKTPTLSESKKRWVDRIEVFCNKYGEPLHEYDRIFP